MKHSKLYITYKKLGVCVAENELFKTVQFTVSGQKYTVYQSQQIATKETQILCEKDRTIYWVQFYPIGYITGTPSKTVFIRPFREADEFVIVLIKGKPSVISGLDENGFVSSRCFQKNKDDIYVMSEEAFKQFNPLSSQNHIL